jgi:UPF0716 protein FxsA
MSLGKWLFIGLLALPVAELLAFLLVASLVGWLWAAALLIATSVVGVLLLRRWGRINLARLREAFAQNGIRAIRPDAPGVGAALGGILLVFPGFITDMLGVALLVPAFRRWAAAKLNMRAARARRYPRDHRVIDLEPGEWRRIPHRRRRRRKPEGEA